MHIKTFLQINSLATAFLGQTGHTVKTVERDGNCFFCCIAYHLFGDDSQHLSVRAALLEFEQQNEVLFNRFLISPTNKLSFEEHVTLLKSLGSWATHSGVARRKVMRGQPAPWYSTIVMIAQKANDPMWASQHTVLYL